MPIAHHYGTSTHSASKGARIRTAKAATKTAGGVGKRMVGSAVSRTKKMGSSVSQTARTAKGRILDKTRPSVKHEVREGSLIDRAHRFLFNRRDESSYFEPHSLGFWRNLLMYLFLFSMVGHAMEIPYCNAMGALFGIVEEDYAAMMDPWYVPYWVYGIGAVALSLIMVPMKINILKRRKTLWGACLEFFLIAVVLCAVLETVMGLIINQPDQFGKYPYWDNSALPFNILGQGWLVNDIFLGIVSVLFVWVLFPLCQKSLKLVGEKWANRIFIGVATFCGLCCIMAYVVPPLMSLF